MSLPPHAPQSLLVSVPKSASRSGLSKRTFLIDSVSGIQVLLVEHSKSYCTTADAPRVSSRQSGPLQIWRTTTEVKRNVSRVLPTASHTMCMSSTSMVMRSEGLKLVVYVWTRILLWRGFSVEMRSSIMIRAHSRRPWARTRQLVPAKNSRRRRLDTKLDIFGSFTIFFAALLFNRFYTSAPRASRPVSTARVLNIDQSDCSDLALFSKKTLTRFHTRKILISKMFKNVQIHT